jgi:hypothetical protein
MSDTICLPSIQSSSTWIVFLSLVPINIVQIGAIILCGLIIAAHILHAFRPRTINSRVERALREVQKVLDEAIANRLLTESSSGGTSSIEKGLRE